MQSKATTVQQYLDELPDERRAALRTVRELILENLPHGFQEVMQWGMIAYIVPWDQFSGTRNKQPLAYLALASQKNHMALYMVASGPEGESEESFREEYLATGKKLDMGKSCLRFRKVEDLAPEVIAKAIRRWTPEEVIKGYQAGKIL